MKAETVTSLAEALGLGPREHIALVGGGGKTSLLLALATELQGAGKRVLTSTTTKMWQREAARVPDLCFQGAQPRWREVLRKAMGEAGHMFLPSAVLNRAR